MPYLTENFLFQISDHYFAGCKVTQPFFAVIEYSYQREKFMQVTNITLPITAIGKLSNGENLTQEITEAARQHHAKNFNNPDDLAGVLTGMPQGKERRKK